MRLIALLVCVAVAQGLPDCDPKDVTFELRTGFVLSAPGSVLDTKPDTLVLSDCIDACRENSTCKALNFETGLCVLFGTSALELPNSLASSEFPVYTIYLEKRCLRNSSRTCGNRAWSFELVDNYKLHEVYVRTRKPVATKEACMESCLTESEFACRSATWETSTATCALSDNDRHSITIRSSFVSSNGSFYLESNCADDNVRLCEFAKKEGRILKTVDAVYEGVETREKCKELCLNSNFRCHSFDYGDTAEQVCRTSHHSTNTLTHIQEPFLETPTSSTYELTSCYNVTIDCRSSDMIVKVKTNKNFNGKIYARTKPNSCVNDVTRSLEFDLRLGYQDPMCSVSQEEPGKFVSEVVIQHHDQIVTNQDVGLSLRCTYSLQNYTVSSNLELDVNGRIPSLKEETAVVPAPTVRLRITGRQGEQVGSAQVGDPLALRFEVLEKDSPYEIFVRDLIAMDGVDASEFTLIDENGCPTDQDIMGPATKVNGSGHILTVPFDAFKFPTSDVVQFKALVTPCLPACQPVNCDVSDVFGSQRSVESYGRKRRQIDTASNKDDMLLVQTIRISDKFVPELNNDAFKSTENGEISIISPGDFEGERCVNALGLFVAAALFLLAQLVLIGAFIYIWNRRRQSKLDDVSSVAVPVNAYTNRAFAR